MNVKIAVLGLIVLAALSAALFDRLRVPGASHAEVSPEDVPRLAQAPDFPFTDGGGKPVSLHTLPEKAIVLHFWASWCAPCVLEFPTLLREAKRREGKIALVAVSLDADRAAMDRFLKKQDPADARNRSLYAVWDRDKKIAQDFGTVSVPETIFIDAKKKMTGKLAGGTDWGTESMRAMLDALAAGSGEKHP